MKKYSEEEIKFVHRLLTDRSSLTSREVEEWLSDCRHRELLDDVAILRSRWAELDIDVDAGYARLLHDLPGKKRKFRMFRRLAAASVACILGVASYMWLHTGDDRTSAMLSVSSERPAPRIELILATGERVALDGKNGVIGGRQESGIRENDSVGLDYREAVAVGQQEVFNTLNVPVGGFYTIQLADGTKVWVNSLSSLRYPVAFTGERRKVFLTGEAYFDVAHSENRPFVVEANGVEMRVYGTEFNVDAYCPGQVRTVLVEGSVGMRVMASGEEVRLCPNQMAEYRGGKESIRLSEVDTYHYTAWRNGEFVFEDEPLDSILERLGRWYDIRVFYSRESLKDHRFSGIINRYEEIADVLRLIERVAIVKFEIKGNTVVVNPAV